MKHKICVVLLTVFLSAIPAFSQTTAAQKASAQFRTAEKAEAALNEKPEANRSRADYLKVIRAYERVYLITPKTSWADNALTSIARLYEVMKDSKNAVKTLQFLLQEYPQTPFREMATRDVARLNGAGDVTLKQSASDVTPKQSASVDNIRFWQEDRSIRIVVDVSGNVTFKEGALSSPNRYFIDISPAQLNSALTLKEWAVESTALQKIRVAQFDASTVRIVLDGPSLKEVTASNLKDPNKITVDVFTRPTTAIPTKPTTTAAPVAPPASPSTPVVPPAAPSTPPGGRVETTTTPSQPAAASGTPPEVVVSGDTSAVAARLEPNRIVTAAKPTSLGDRSLIRSLGLKLSRVVIDAGHGGHDVGSIGPTGFTEKELVLDLARRLKTLIETQMGAEVIMTRDADTFVALETRTQRANQEKADLFVSIHANSSPEKNVRGVETFFLNLNTESRDALATATRENAASEMKIHELQDLLQKIVLNDKADESRELARHVQNAMSTRTNAGSNRGVKQAPFVVLIGAAMPSILAEVSFISNPDEEKRLKTADYRQKIAESLFQGIKSYAETLSSSKAAN
jgi:N-acetylmuramoyl-L-alanine amidase